MIQFSKIHASVLLTVLLSSLQAHGLANDWSKPCFSGVCHYDLPTSANGTGPSGTLKIWGANTSITDITPAAGWQVLGCDADAMEQDIRLVCQNDDEEKSADGCGHLFATNGSAGAGVQGAVGKIVRLPEECGKNPFAIIAKAWVPADQSVPGAARKRLARRGGAVPVVKAVTLSVDFGTHGKAAGAQTVNFAIVAANVPGAAAQGDLDTSKITTNSSGVAVRDLGGFISGALGSINSLNDFGIGQTLALPPVNIDEKFELINAKLTCSQMTGVGNSTVAVDVSLKVDVEAKANADIVIGVAASGTFIPPSLNSFGISSTISADLGGTVTLTAGVGGTIDSGKIPIANVALGGMNFPGILMISPSFQIVAEASASLELDVDLSVGVNYNISKASFVFPSGGNLGGTFTPGDTPLSVSAQPGAKATGMVMAHITPSLDLAVSVLNGLAKTTVFANLDASASATLTADATGAETNVTVIPREVGQVGSIGHADGATVAPITRDEGSVMDDSVTGDESKAVAIPKREMTKEVTRSAAPPPVTFGGCLEVDTGLSVNVGANAGLFGLFNPSLTLPLFTGKFTLFKQCFGDQNKRRDVMDERRMISEMLQPRALQCNLNMLNLTALVDETVPGAQIN